MIKLIVGLGNPGFEYHSTRHNIGFLVVDAFANLKKITISREKFKSFFTSFTDNEKNTLYICKPQTYMNLSGTAVVRFAHFYKIYPEEIVVISDDIDLDFGTIKIKQKGGSGGHNGLNSIIESLGSDEFTRIKVGIGKPPLKDKGSDYVLSKFKPDEEKILPDILAEAANAVDDIVTKSVVYAMNKYNKRKGE